MQLPWDWLAVTLLYAPAAGLRHHQKATAPQQMQEDLHQRHVSWSDDSVKLARTRI